MLRGDMGPDSRACLEVQSLSAGYGEVPIVRDVSLDVWPGQIVAVVGPNGAGKSTLLKSIVGIVHNMGGSVILEGEDVSGLSTEARVRKGLGYVPQLNDVFGALSVRENLLMGGYRVGKSELSTRMEEVYGLFPQLDRMRLRTASRLSGGERKMLALGRALMAHPRVLILDEPTANLSPELSAVVLEEHVRGLAESGVGVLLVEQKAQQAVEIGDWSCVLVAGEIAASGARSELLARPDFGELMLGGGGGGRARTEPGLPH